ncbi:MAG: ABC transporter permease [Bdellovibrionota bacterium]
MGRKVGFRYLRAKKGSSFLSAITAISIGGVGVGVLTMVVTLSVMAGFEQELKKRLFSAETHILVESNEGYFRASQEQLAQIKQSSHVIKSVYPVLQTEVILRSGKKVNGSILKGVGPEQLNWVKKQVIEWAPNELLAESSEARLFMGAEMGFELGIVPGDRVTVVSPVESEGPFGAVPRVKRYVIEGIYKTGVPEQELHVVFSADKDVESFLKQSGLLSQIEIRVGTLEEAPGAARAIEKVLGNAYLVRPWQVLNAHLFQSLQLERTAMFCILIFIVIVATFNIVSTLTMMVLEKKRGLSILRAMGATRRQVGSIFLWEGLAIGLIGVVGGTIIGIVICEVLRRYPIIELPEVYYDRTLPVVVQPTGILIVVVSALVIVLLGALAPARRASDLPPIQGIREG